MKKNKIVMSVISGLLVAAVAVGGTLAYLSDTSNQVTNTFNVGSGYEWDEDHEHQGLWLDETANPAPGVNPTEISSTNRTEIGVDYTGMYPGTVVAKDPTFHLTANSTESYVFARVTGADAMVAAGYVISETNLGFTLPDGTVIEEPDSSLNDMAWVKVEDYGTDEDAGLDGVYRYYTTVAGGENGADLAALFNSVKLSKDVDSDEFAKILPSTIDIAGVAVQTANLTADEALVEAKLHLDKQLF